MPIVAYFHREGEWRAALALLLEESLGVCYNFVVLILRGLNMKSEQVTIVATGAVVGFLAAMLVFFGNPANMGLCIACFLRDTAGGLGLHAAKAVQYIRPEISGLVLGALGAAYLHGEFSPKGGSSPLTRFVLGFFAMIGCLMFLGCPFRMLLRIAGGDLNAVVGLVGFAVGIYAGIFFLNRGYSLKRTYKMTTAEGSLMPAIAVALLVLLVAAPTFIHFTKAGGGPGAKHAAVAVSLIAALAVGYLTQRTRFCMIAGLRDLILFRETKMLWGFVAVIAAAAACNVVLTSVTGAAFFKLGFAAQPIAHTDALWNVLGLFLAGFACVLLGGCPMRQLVLAGEGNSDSAVTLLGFLVGAAFAHNFGLASSANGPTANGQIAVIIGIVVVTVIAYLNTYKK